jgi:flagellum-specific peptidoglycan hydrolase FlgJ
MGPLELHFVQQAAKAADSAGHLFPEMAGCEAALESSYGRSLLAIEDNNLFGMKQHRHALYGTAILPTREFEQGEWVAVSASWVKYPSQAACFQDRMATLVRLSSTYPHYAAALRALDPESYIREISQTWSTDPARAEKVLSIYREAGYGGKIA